MLLHNVDNIASKKRRRIKRRNATTEPIDCCPHVTPAIQQDESDEMYSSLNPIHSREQSIILVTTGHQLRTIQNIFI